jgi:3-isopropylmalate/(R)-2-methylmalate dehydratase small subunit
MLQYGIRAIIGTSFGGIFADNAANNGLLLITLASKALAPLADEVTGCRTCVTIDLAQQTIMTRAHHLAFDIDPAVREALMLGLDPIGQTLARAERLRAFELAYLAERPWLVEGAGR